MLENRSSADSHVTAYRPDLDGLRAVAVLAVIAYHLAEDLVPGGYLGVDVFFVLSGYLITSIIWREAALGQFSLVTFYNRRIRRILPALLLVMLCTLAASLLLLLPLDLVGMARSALAALGFAANVYFWRDTNYFSRLAEQKPLLHLWSLGVEEQFYVLFPLLLVLLARLGRRPTVAAIALLSAGSLAANFVALRGDLAASAFYLLPTRAWELGAGALLAVAPITIQRPRMAGVAGLAGLALVAVSLARGRSLFPAAVPDALAAVAGATLLVLAGAAPGNLVSRLLSLRGAVFVGLISYSLYLWHWPIIVLLKYYLVREPTGLEGAAALALMFTCAVLSWRYVERPFRSRDVPIRTVYIATATATLAVAAVALTILGTQGFPARLDPSAAQINAAVGTNFRCPVPDQLYFSGSRACELNLPSREPAAADVVLFGNSHAQMYAPLVRELLKSKGLQGLLVPMNSCTPTLGFNISASCGPLAARNLDAIAALPRARVVILATTWPRAKPSGAVAPAFIEGLDHTIDRLLAAGKTIVLAGPVAAPGWDVASSLSRSLAFGRELALPLFEPRASFLEHHGEAISHFGKRGDVEFVETHEAQCSNARCEFLMDGRSLFADSTHLAGGELPRFRPAFEGALERALAR